MSYYQKIEQQVQRTRSRSRNELKIAALKILQNNPLFDIELASGCNITCSFCPRDKLKRTAKIMTPETFNHVLKLLPSNAIVMFAGFGEPLLNKNLETYIKKLKDRGMSSCIITNGILLTPKRQEDLIKAGVDQLQISYQKIDKDFLHRKTLDENLNYLAKNRPERLRIQLNLLLHKENQKELLELEKLAKSWGFDTYIRRTHNRGGHYDINNSKNPILSSCGIFSAVTPITSDGKILACSNDLGEDSYFKSVTNTNWNEIVSWKEKVLQNDLQFKPCLKCNDDYRWIILDYLSVDKNK